MDMVFKRNKCRKDIYVSASQVRKFKLRTEDRVVGEVREPSGDEKIMLLKSFIS